MTRTTIAKMVYSTYPVTKREKCCALLKRRMDAKREALKKRLIDEWEGKNKILVTIQPGEPEV